MDDILYLIHTTNKPDCLNWTELKTPKFNVDDQFPGIYLSIVTKNNIENDNFYAGKYVIFISKKFFFNQITTLMKRTTTELFLKKTHFFLGIYKSSLKHKKPNVEKTPPHVFQKLCFMMTLT